MASSGYGTGRGALALALGVVLMVAVHVASVHGEDAEEAVPMTEEQQAEEAEGLTLRAAPQCKAVPAGKACSMVGTTVALCKSFCPCRVLPGNKCCFQAGQPCDKYKAAHCCAAGGGCKWVGGKCTK